jgi:hypothetical protein
MVNLNNFTQIKELEHVVVNEEDDEKRRGIDTRPTCL